MNDSPCTNLTFDQALGELEQTVRDLEDGQLSLEEALGRYERGIGLLRQCYTQLRQAEQKVLLLTGVDGEGQPVTQPFEPSPTGPDVAKADGKRRRKRDEEDEDEKEIPF
jgi:exodeoxyribonuclease VII small subunit